MSKKADRPDCECLQDFGSCEAAEKSVAYHAGEMSVKSASLKYL